MPGRADIAEKALQFISSFGWVQARIELMAEDHPCDRLPTCQGEVLLRKSGMTPVDRMNDGERIELFKLIAKHLLGNEAQLDGFKIAYKQVAELRNRIAHNRHVKVRHNEDSDLWYLAIGYYQPVSPEDDSFWLYRRKGQLYEEYLDQAIATAEWLIDTITWTSWQSGMNGNARILDYFGREFSDENRPAKRPPHNLLEVLPEEEEPEYQDE